MSDPRVSVIMPAYNCEHLVSRAIESILQQNGVTFELIVVDDGSTDRTARMVEQYTKIDDRVKMKLMGSNQGQSAARNEGIKLARGQYIAYQDADDYSLPGRLRRQCAILDKCSLIGLVGTNALLKDKSGKTREYIPLPDDYVPLPCYRLLSHPRKSLLTKNQVFCGSVMHRKSLMKMSGMWGSDIDWGLWIRMQEHSEVVILPMPYYVYCKTQDGADSRRGYEDNHRISMETMRDCYARTGDRGALRTMRRYQMMIIFGKCSFGTAKYRAVSWAIYRLCGFLAAITTGNSPAPATGRK